MTIVAEILGSIIGFWIVYAIMALIFKHEAGLTITIMLFLIANLCTLICGKVDIIAIVGCILGSLSILFIAPIQVKSKKTENMKNRKEASNSNPIKKCIEKNNNYFLCEECGKQSFGEEECSNCGFKFSKNEKLLNIKYQDYLIVKTTEERIKKVGGIYNATRYRWKVKIDNVKKYPYVLSVVNGYVREVFVVDYWQKAQDRYGETGIGRYEFTGHLASKEIRKFFIHKRIPALYRKKGMSNPVLYPKSDAIWE